MLRAVSARSFADDPLRILRAARIAAGLGLEVDPGRADLARAEAGRAGGAGGGAAVRRAAPAAHGRRPAAGACSSWTSSRRRRPCCPSSRRFAASSRTRTTTSTCTGTRMEVLARLIEVEARPGALSRATAAADVRELLAEPLADELTRGGALRFAALFHDLGKPETRAVGEGGRVLFIGHDRAGAAHRPRALLAPADQPPPCRLPGRPDPQPPAARLPGPRAAAVAAPRLRLPAGHRARLRRRHAAHGRRPARHPGRADAGRRRSTPTSSWPAR